MKPPVASRAAAFAALAWIITTLLAPGVAVAQSLQEMFRYNERGHLSGHQVNGTETNHRYDSVDRLIEQSSPSRALGNARRYVMDADGNRLADQRSTYMIQPGAQRVAARDGVALIHSPAGHLLADRTWLNGRWAQRSFSWNMAGQLKSVTLDGAPVASYLYNEGGQRTRKTLTAAAAGLPQVTLYRYDPQGQLVLEVAGTAVQAPGVVVSPGQVLVRYIWQDDVPVAVIWPPMTPGNPGASTDRVAHLAVDHLNTPRRALDAQGVVVWTWQGEAFGADLPDEDADRDGRRAVINLRFPGQYFDTESGLHYNWHRYYDPQVGRYTQSDPIGLAGGINTYSYVENNPLSFTDPEGLVKLHGNWCGPDWTGGFTKPYDRLSGAERKAALPPATKLDGCCQSHDIVYAVCRKAHPCDAANRQKCFEQADRDLSSCASQSGSGYGANLLLFGNPQSRIQNYMRDSSPAAGDNAKECSCTN